MLTNIINNRKKDSKKKHVKNINVFLKKKNIKGEKKARERYQSFTERVKKKTSV